MTQSHHSYSSGCMFINLDRWESLSPQQKADLKAACEYAAEKQRAFNMTFYEEKTKELIEKHGVKFTDPDPSFLLDLIAIGKKMANSPKYMKIFGPDLVRTMYP
jgi:TRAP-type C4-dicarboxylate transport system substrate-binding protein